jgi:ADP-heptose:LPS heptosyltransferase
LIRSVVIPIASGVGNAIMAVPMVRQLSRGLGGPRITVIARTEAIGEPLRRLPEVTETLITGDGVRGFARFILWGRRARADLYLVAFPSNRWHYNLLVATCGARRRRVLHGYPVGYWRAMHFVPAERVRADPALHDVEQNLRLLAHLGIDPDPTERPTFRLCDADRAAADTLLRDCGLTSGQQFIAIHPGSGRTVFRDAKRWPAEKFAVLASRLHAGTGQTAVILEGPDEPGVADGVMHHLDSRQRVAVRPLVLRGPLGDAAGVLERASLYVGNDTALAHLAAAVGRRAVTIFGPTIARCISPFGNSDLVVRVSKPCAPCFTYPFKTPYPSVSCRAPMCIDEIAVDDVLDAAERALSASLSTPDPVSA